MNAATHVIQTNLGPMTPEQISEELEFRRYKHHRLALNVRHETMARWYGDVLADQFQARLHRELGHSACA